MKHISLAASKRENLGSWDLNAELSSNEEFQAVDSVENQSTN